MPKAQKAGFPTYWTCFGQGPRQALMIHCSLAHSGSWAGVARHLSDVLTMTAFDMPGHGRSAGWDGRGEIQAVTTRIAAAFAEGAVDIIGHSFGATVALRLAVTHPELVRSLVLIEPVFFAVALRDHPQMRAPFEAQMADFSAAMRAGDHLAAAQAFTRVWGGGALWEETPAAQQAQLAAQMPLVAAGQGALYDDVGGMLAPGVLEALDRPVHLIEGALSPAIIPAINKGLAARLPRAVCTVITEAGHMAPITHPAPVSQAILEFLQQT